MFWVRDTVRKDTSPYGYMTIFAWYVSLNFAHAKAFFGIPKTDRVI